MSHNSNIYKVLIVGGGASGLAATQRLIKKGINCLLLEAQSRLGGRINTAKHGNHFLEYGAQWVHGEDGNVVYALAKENHLLDEDKTLKQTGIGDTVFVREDTSILDTNIVDLFQMLMANFREQGEDELATYKDSVGKYYTDKFLEVNKWGSAGLELLDWYGRFQCCIDGSNSWFDPSGIGSVEYEECPGNAVLNWNQGFETLVNYLKADIPESVIRLNSPVKRIVWRTPELSSVTPVTSSVTPSVTVELESGETLLAEHVIVTSSLAVLKEVHQEMFEPKLSSSHVNAIEGLGMDVVDKVFLEFPSQWWGDQCDGFSLLREGTHQQFHHKNWERRILGFYEVYKQPRMLCAWITGDTAKEMEKCDHEELKDRCMKVMRDYLSPHYSIPDPVWWDCSKWHSNPYVRGSYSFRSVTSERVGAKAEDLAEPICSQEGVPLVCFCGEATHSSFFSTVHGAVESGWREADRILRLSRSTALKVPVKKRESFDVVIVGGGASGLGAALELERNGVESVVILEASDRVGGRVNTIYPPGGFCELGAQWIHGQLKNLFYDVTNPRGLIGEHLSVDGEGDFYTDKGLKLDPDFVYKVVEICDQLKEECMDVMNKGNPPPSLGHYIGARFEEILDGEEHLVGVREMKEALYHWNIRWERIDTASDSLHQLSAKRWSDYHAIGGFCNMNPKRGMQSLMDSVRSDVTADIHLNTRVVKIDYATSVSLNWKNRLVRQNGKRPVQITCSNGDVYDCNHVIVTCSLRYLKRHKEHLFSPPLPLHLDQAITNLGFGVIDKIFLEFETPFWDSDFTGIHLVWTGEELPDFNRTQPDTKLINGRKLNMEDFWYRAISGFDPVYGHKSMLCGWISGPEAEYMEGLDEKEVGRMCTRLLRQFTKNKLISEPINVYRSQYATNELFLGSYSHRLSSTDHSGRDYVTDINEPVYANTTPLHQQVPVLTVAGEANSLNAHSTVHGALENGVSQARHYIEFNNRFTENAQKNELKSKL